MRPRRRVDRGRSITTSMSPSQLRRAPVPALTPEQYVLRFPPSRRLDRLVLRDIAAHADYSDGDGKVWGEGAVPSVPGIAERIGYSVRSVQYALRRLEEDGRLDLTPRLGRTNVFRIVRHLHAVEPVHDDAESVDEPVENSASAGSPARSVFAPGGATVAPDLVPLPTEPSPEGSPKRAESNSDAASAAAHAPPERREAAAAITGLAPPSPAALGARRLTTAGGAGPAAAAPPSSPGWAAVALIGSLPAPNRKLGSLQPERRDRDRRGFGCPRCAAPAGEPCRGLDGRPRLRNHNERRRARPAESGAARDAGAGAQLLTRREVQAVACPHCGVPARVPCRGRRGGVRDSNHASRADAAHQSLGLAPPGDSPG